MCTETNDVIFQWFQVHLLYVYLLSITGKNADFYLAVSTLAAKPPNLIFCQIFQLYDM